MKDGFDEFEQRPLRLTQQDVIGASLEVFPAAIGSVRPIHHDFRPIGARPLDHPEGSLTHPAQAHLGKKIEIVFVNRDDIRPIFRQRLCESLLGVLQHAVEERHRKALFPQKRCGVECPQRRVGLQFPRLLPVVIKVIRVG